MDFFGGRFVAIFYIIGLTKFSGSFTTNFKTFRITCTCNKDGYAKIYIS